MRDFSGGSTSVEIEWDVRTVYDFLFSLSEDAGTSDDLPAEDRRWLADARAARPAADRAAVARLFETELCIFLAAFAIQERDVADAAGLVARLEAADPIELLRTILFEALDDPDRDERFARLAAGDSTAAAEIAARIADHKSGLAVLLDDPAASQRQMVDVLRAWAGPFSEIEGRVRETIERDVSLRSGDRGRLAGSDLIEHVTGGIRWLPEPGVDKVILAPSYFSRPYNFVLAGEGWRFFGYPVADAAVRGTDPLAPAPALLRLHRALGDGTRLRILKLLAGNDLYLTEIAQLLELSKPTIKHHLAQLRSAGLVTVVTEGTMTYYSLRRERLDDGAAEIRRFLLD